MGLIASLPEIDKVLNSVYVLHEKFERLIPSHKHKKGQLSYVEGGLAYVLIDNKTYIIPARHYFWIPCGISHELKVSHSATILRSIFFYANDDYKNPFYNQIGIYPINELLLQMIKYSENWEGNIKPIDDRYSFLVAIKNILPEISPKLLPIALPNTDNERMQKILEYLKSNIAENHSLPSISNRFAMSERSLSRLFKSSIHTSFLQYVKLLRMAKAFEMIIQTDKSMSEIAESIGYYSLSAFSNTFYQFTTLRPSDYRHYK